MALYPRCVAALAGALKGGPDAAFAYAIQEVTGDPERFAQAGGDYLLSFLGWEPERLRRCNYIHMPVLIRADALRAVGGFAEGDDLSGFEDYDLWCRIAERGGHGVLVRQILARRPETGHSEVLAAMHPAPGPTTRALAARAPRLLTGAFTEGH